MALLKTITDIFIKGMPSLQMQSASLDDSNFMPTIVDYRAGRYKPGLVRLYFILQGGGQNISIKCILLN